jgi:hypothetical protein
MSDKILLVTPPDDILLDGVRITLVNLNETQTKIISDVLTQLSDIPTTILYVWNSNTSNDTEWVLDKKHKSDIIIFNANSDDDILVGYLAAQPNSHYFGTLKSLSSINNCAIYTVDQVTDIIGKIILKHGIR